MKSLRYFLMLVAVALVQTSCLTGMGTDFERPAADPSLSMVASTTVIYANEIDEVRFTVKFGDQELTADRLTFYNTAVEPYEKLTDVIQWDGSMIFKTRYVGYYPICVSYAGEGGESYSEPILIRAISEVNLEDRQHEYTADQKGNECLDLTPSTSVFQADQGRAVLVARYKGKVLNASEYEVYNKDTGEKLDLETDLFYDANGVGYTLPIFVSEQKQDILLWIQHKVYQTSDRPTSISVVDFPVPSRIVDDNPGKTNFHHRAFLTKITGTSCGYCPAMSAPLHDLQADPDFHFDDKAVVAEAYTYSSTHEFYPGAIDEALGASGAPWVFVDFLYKIGQVNYETNKSNLRGYIEEALRSPAKAGIAAGMALEGNQLVVRMSVKAAETSTFRVGAWLCENGLYANQTNYPATGVSSKDYDFDTHNNVVRIADSYNSSRNCSGHDLNDGNPLAAGEIADYLFIMTLDEGWKPENCHLVLFVSAPYAGGDYTVTNAVRTTSLTSAVDFEYAD